MELIVTLTVASTSLGSHSFIPDLVIQQGRFSFRVYVCPHQQGGRKVLREQWDLPVLPSLESIQLTPGTFQTAASVLGPRVMSVCRPFNESFSVLQACWLPCVHAPLGFKFRHLESCLFRAGVSDVDTTLCSSRRDSHLVTSLPVVNQHAGLWFSVRPPLTVLILMWLFSLFYGYVLLAVSSFPGELLHMLVYVWCVYVK